VKFITLESASDVQVLLSSTPKAYKLVSCVTELVTCYFLLETFYLQWLVRFDVQIKQAAKFENCGLRQKGLEKILEWLGRVTNFGLYDFP